LGTQEFGEYLRSRREAQGLSIDDVSERTKIHIRHIRAIEEGRLEALPGIVYAKAFVRHYARAVGEDPDAIAVQFHQVIHLQGESDAVTRSRRRSRRRTRRESRFPWPWLIVIIGLAALGILIARTLPSNENAAVPHRATPSGISSIPSEDRLNTPIVVDPELITQDQPDQGFASEPIPGGDELPANLGLAANGLVDETESVEQVGRLEPLARDVDQADQADQGSRVVAGDQGQVGQGLSEQVVGAAADVEAPVTSGAATAGSAGTPDEPPATTTLAAVTSGVVLEVAVERACWFNVEADGVLIFSGVLDDGQSATWVANEELRVRYGRPEGVFITLNGEFLGRAGTGVITRVYGREGVIEL